MVTVAWILQQFYLVDHLADVQFSLESPYLVVCLPLTVLPVDSVLFPLKITVIGLLFFICVYVPTLASSSSCREDFIFDLSELEGFINAQFFDNWW